MEALSTTILSNQSRRESSARSYPRRLPLVVAEARGCTIIDVDGHHYIDCLAGAGALPLGHNHPVVVEAVRGAIDAEVPWLTLDITTPFKERFIDEILSTLPPELANGRIQFCSPSGADAVEAALKLTKIATGRPGVMAFAGAYHGMTHGTLAVSGSNATKAPLGALGADVTHLPFPMSLRPVLGSNLPEDAAACARLLEWTLTDPYSGTGAPAAVIVEPVQGEGGVHPMPRHFAARIREITATSGVPLIFDEVQTGLGRTGTTWAFEGLGVVPDVLVASKAIGGGLPLAVVIYREELDQWRPGSHAGTFRGNQLAMAAGAATIHHVVTEGLAERAAELGDRLRLDLLDVSSGDRRVGEVRGRGLMLGVELVDPVNGEPDGATARAVQAAMLERGVIVEVGGRGDAVVRILAPLILSDDEATRVVAAFDAALQGTKRT